jgi:hypothetical protein
MAHCRLCNQKIKSYTDYWLGMACHTSCKVAQITEAQVEYRQSQRGRGATRPPFLAVPPHPTPLPPGEREETEAA